MTTAWLRQRIDRVPGLGLAAVLLLAGCPDKAPDGPHVSSVTPSSAPATATTPITVAGRFPPALTVDYDDESRSRLSFDFRARLGDRELGGVTYRSGTELGAIVPAGLAAGVYDLRVSDPRGRAGTLERAFTVLGALDGGGDGRRDGPQTDRPGTTDRRTEGGVDSIVWKSVPAGSFSMGSPGAEPCRGANETQHQVSLTRGFEISRTEMTQAQFQALRGYNPSASTGCGPDCPVENVTWHEAAAACNALSQQKGLPLCFSCSGTGPSVSCTVVPAYAAGKIYECPGYRLPTEAEWEYAYRAGTTSALYSGAITALCNANDPNADLIGWYNGSAPHPVGGKQANAWGLVDMAGNVWEWTHDIEVNDLGSGPVTDPWGAASGGSHIYRGGSWHYGLRYLRAAVRAGWNEANRTIDSGFRCVRTR